MTMDFNANTQENAYVLRIGGELDELSAGDLRPVLRSIAESQPAKVLLDLSQLRLIDSAGVGIVVALFKTVRTYAGSLAVMGVQEQPLAILRLLKLDRVLLRDAA